MSQEAKVVARFNVISKTRAFPAVRKFNLPKAGRISVRLQVAKSLYLCYLKLFLCDWVTYNSNLTFAFKFLDICVTFSPVIYSSSVHQLHHDQYLQAYLTRWTVILMQATGMLCTHNVWNIAGEVRSLWSCFFLFCFFFWGDVSLLFLEPHFITVPLEYFMHPFFPHLKPLSLFSHQKWQIKFLLEA